MSRNPDSTFLPSRDNISSFIHHHLVKRIFFYFILLLTSGLVFAMYVKDPGIDGYYTVMYEDMIYGKAYKPFVTRALLPAITRTLTSAVPGPVKQNLNKMVEENSTLKLMFVKLSWKTLYTTEYIIGLTLMFLSLLGFTCVIRILLHDVYKVSETFGRCFQVGAVAGLPPFMKYYSHIYDFPALLLFTSGLILIFRRKWIYFLIIYLISCFNKETTILLTVIFLLYFYKDKELSPGKYLKLFLAQMVIFLFSRVLLLMIFKDNPGGLTEHHFIGHNTGLLKPYTFISLAAVLFFILLLIHSWKKKPLLLRRGIFIFPIMLVSALFFGFLDEFRAYYEAYPVVLLLMTYSFAEIAGIEISVKESDDPAKRSAGRT